MRHERLKYLGSAGLLMLAAGCVHVSSDPIEVKPIQITADVNVNVRVDRQLDDFFSFEDKYISTTQPATQPRNQAL